MAVDLAKHHEGIKYRTRRRIAAAAGAATLTASTIKKDEQKGGGDYTPEPIDTRTLPTIIARCPTPEEGTRS